MPRKSLIAGVVLIAAVLIISFAGMTLQNFLGWLLGGLVGLCVRLVVVFVRVLTLH